jgi:hypothetical protein
MSYLLLWVVVILSIVAVLVKHMKRERFVSSSASSSVVLCTNVLQNIQWLLSKHMQPRSLEWDDGAKWKELLQSSASDGATLYALAPGSKNIFLLLDPLDRQMYIRSRLSVGTSPKGYFCALYRREQALHAECNFGFAGKRVGFLDRSDYLFIQSILHGYRMADPTELRRIPLSRWKHLEEELHTLDVIIAFVIPKSPLHQLLMKQNLVVSGFRNLDPARVRLFYPFVRFESVRLSQVLQDTPGSALQVKASEKDSVLPSMRLEMVVVKGMLQERFENQSDGNYRLKWSKDVFHPAYRCYGDLDIEHKHLCESKFDVIGLPKRRRTTWDRPCIKNEDCPFFNKKKMRGGCLRGGVCEMPVGIRRVAYRKYQGRGVYAPFCYECPPKDRECCNRHPNPEYAFMDDKSRTFMPMSIVG